MIFTEQRREELRLASMGINESNKEYSMYDALTAMKRAKPGKEISTAVLKKKYGKDIVDLLKAKKFIQTVPYSYVTVVKPTLAGAKWLSQNMVKLHKSMREDEQTEDMFAEKAQVYIFPSKEKAMAFKKAVAKKVHGKLSVRKTKKYGTYTLVFKPMSYNEVVKMAKLYKVEPGKEEVYKIIKRDEMARINKDKWA